MGESVEELYAMQGDIRGITRTLQVDGLPDPYEVFLLFLPDLIFFR